MPAAFLIRLGLSRSGVIGLGEIFVDERTEAVVILRLLQVEECGRVAHAGVAFRGGVMVLSRRRGRNYAEGRG